MFNKKTSYEVNVQGITFWRKKINVDNLKAGDIITFQKEKFISAGKFHLSLFY